MISIIPLLMMLSNPTQQAPVKNVLGTTLEACCFKPVTGFYRDGYCRTGSQDYGVHTVCAVMTADFLAYTSTCGNDLSTPQPTYGFPGLKPGDKWCLCVSRWAEAERAGCAPKVYLPGCHIKSLETVSMETLKKYTID